MSTVVNSTNLRQDYNTVVENLAKDAFQGVVNYFNNLMDENGNKVSLYFEDICNMVTQAAQAARRDFVAQNNVSADTATKA